MLEGGAITIRTAAIAENYRLMRKLAPDAGVAAVVKADAYGLGLQGVLPALTGAGCDSFFVARIEEGITLRLAVPKARIFVLDGAAAADAIPALVAHRLIPVLGSLAGIAAWQAGAKGADMALHVDTGMNRLGLPPEELSGLAARPDGIAPVLVMSHLACSDDADAAMNRTQLSRFRAALALLPPVPASLAASGGVLLGRDYHFDLVRPGIGLYGGNPQAAAPNPMQPVARLAGRILQLRQIAPGDSVGYGATFTADRPMTIATIALGYADGVLRAASASGFAMVNDHVAPFVGRVSMDLITLDVTGIAGVAVGGEAELFGPSLPVDEAAAAWGTVSYELLTGLSRRIPRVYLDA